MVREDFLWKLRFAHMNLWRLEQAYGPESWVYAGEEEDGPESSGEEASEDEVEAMASAILKIYKRQFMLMAPWHSCHRVTHHGPIRVASPSEPSDTRQGHIGGRSVGKAAG